LPRLFLFLLFVATGCAGGSPLDSQQIDTARDRWRAVQLSNYDLRMSIDGDRIQKGSFEITVLARRVQKVVRNGETIPSRDAFYTVDGMFDFLGDELQMAQNPQRYWQVGKDASIHQRVTFDDKLGFVRQYIRAVRGTQHNIVIKVEELTARSIAVPARAPTHRP